MIAIIPARGGSKGLPGKNIKELCGKPLIAYTIQAAQEATCVDRVIVSTDDAAIADVAGKYGAEVPFLRPAELATDTASAVDVYLHAVGYIEKETGVSIRHFMVLLPTAPMRNGKHIDDAWRMFQEKQCTTLISVKAADIPPSWYMLRGDSGTISNCGYGRESAFMSNRQSDEAYVIPNGAIYILDHDLLRKGRTYYAEDTVGYLMDGRDSVDIDTPDDFLYAEYLMKRR